MKVLDILNIFLLCMAVSVKTEDVEDVSTTTVQDEGVTAATTDATINTTTDTDMRRFFESIQGNAFEIDPGIASNGPQKSSIDQPDSDLKVRTKNDLGSDFGQNEYPAADLLPGPISADLSNYLQLLGPDSSRLYDSIKDIPLVYEDEPFSQGSFPHYHPYTPQTAYPGLNTPELQEYEPSDDNDPDSFYDSPSLIYSTSMPPISGLTPCENSNMLQNVLNNLLGLLLAKVDGTPKLNDVKFAIDSIKSQIDANPKWISDPQLYPKLKYYEQRTAPGAQTFLSRLKRNTKTRIVFKQEIPRINEPECKEAFLKLMALSYKAYIEASKLSDCKVKNQLIPDDPFNPSKIIIPNFEEKSGAENNWDKLFIRTNTESNSPNLKGYRLNITQQTITTKIKDSRSNNRPSTDNLKEDKANLEQLFSSIIQANEKTDATPKVDFETQETLAKLEKELDALISPTPKYRAAKSPINPTTPNKNLFEYKESTSYNSQISPINQLTLDNLFLQTKLDQPLKEPLLNPLPYDYMNNNKNNIAEPSNMVFKQYVPPKSSLDSLFNYELPSSEHNKVKPLRREETLGKVKSSDLLPLPFIVPDKQEPQLRMLITDSGPIANVPTSPWSPLISPLMETKPSASSLRNGWLSSTQPSRDLRFLPKHMYPWLKNQNFTNQTKFIGNNNSSDAERERPQVRNNRSTDIRYGLPDANFVRNNILTNAQSLNNLLPTKVRTVSITKPFLTNPYINQNALRNFQLNSLTPAKLLLLKRMLARYGTSEHFKSLGGNLGMIAFWLTHPGKTELAKHEITQKNTINVYLENVNKGFSEKQKQFILEALNNLGSTTTHNEFSQQNNALLKMILTYMKKLLHSSGEDVNPEILNQVYEMVSKLPINSEKKQLIYILLTVYVNWVTQNGLDGDIDQILDNIQLILEQETGYQPDPEISDEILKRISDLVRNVIVDTDKQKKIIDQMKLYMKWVEEHDVDLNKPENMNQLVEFLKKAIAKTLQEQTSPSSEQETEENQLPLHPLIITNIEKILENANLSDEDKEFLTLNIKAYILAEKQKGVDFNKVENVIKLILFIRDVLKRLKPADLKPPITSNEDDFDSNSDNSNVPSILIPNEDVNATPDKYPVNPSILNYINQLINKFVKNPAQREVIISHIQAYIYKATTAGINLNEPENFKKLIIVTKTIIIKVLTTSSNPITTTPASKDETPLNPAIEEYLHKLIASLVPDEEQKEIVMVKVNSYIKYFISKGIDLNVKTNLNKLIWIIVSVIKSVVQSKPVIEEKPIFSSALHPDSVEIIYKLEQKLIIKGFTSQKSDNAEGPNSYVKYRVPYHVFTGNLKDLMLRRPSLRTNPDKLSKELELTSNITEVSPELQGLPKRHIINMIAHNGSFVDAKIPLDDTQSLRNAADLEKASAFERTVHDLDVIINNSTEVDITKLDEYEHMANQDTEVGTDLTRSYMPDSSGFDPLGFNENIPFLNFVNSRKKETEVNSENSKANLLPNDVSATGTNLPFTI